MSNDMQPPTWPPPGQPPVLPPPSQRTVPDSPPKSQFAALQSWHSGPGVTSTRRRPPSAVIAGLAVFALALATGTGYFLWPKHTPAGSTKSGTPAVSATASATANAKASTPPAPKPSAAPIAKILPTGWVDQSVHPVTAPVVVAGRVVVYTADGGTLSLRALDPVTGATLWATRASVASNTSGQPFRVESLASTVFYYTPAADTTDGTAHLAAMDAATGRVKWTSQNAFPFTELPTLCSDKTALCVSAYAGKGQAVAIRIDVATGSEHVLTSNGGRTLGPGVLDPGLRKPEFIEHLDEKTGKVVWRVPVATLAGSAVSSDEGWNWDSYGDVYVGWLAAVTPKSSKVMNLDREKTIGVRASDGRRLWVKPGLYGCPAQGLLAHGRPIAVRCLFKGTITFDAAGNPQATNLNAKIQGFDVHTGATLWTADLGNMPSAIGIGSRPAVRMTADVFAFTDAANRTVLVNLKTGAIATATPGANGWCLQQDVTWNSSDNLDASGKPSTYVSGDLIGACTPAGAPSSPTDGTASGMGATAGGYFVWSSKDGMHGFKITKKR